MYTLLLLCYNRMMGANMDLNSNTRTCNHGNKNKYYRLRLCNIIDTYRHSQQLWSCRDVASILCDIYPTLGCHDTQNVPEKITIQVNQNGFIYMYMYVWMA